MRWGEEKTGLDCSVELHFLLLPVEAPFASEFVGIMGVLLGRDSQARDAEHGLGLPVVLSSGAKQWSCSGAAGIDSSIE